MYTKPDERISMIEEIRAICFTDMPEPEPIDRSEAIPDEEVSWERILKEEPEVGTLIRELREASGKPYLAWWAYVDAHGTTPKARLCHLVGWRARNPKGGGRGIRVGDRRVLGGSLRASTGVRLRVDGR
jgi:hypothetical protein